MIPPPAFNENAGNVIVRKSDPSASEEWTLQERNSHPAYNQDALAVSKQAWKRKLPFHS